MSEAKHGTLLDIRDLSVAFDVGGQSTTAVDKLSLSVDRGEVLALVGESGSGKSVTSMAVLGLLPENADRTGEVVFDGENLLGVDHTALRRIRGERVAMIFQEPMTALDPVFTIGKQIEEAICAHRSMSKEQARSRALELLQLVKVPEPERRIEQYPHQLSGGQLQRVVIAMAVSCEPDLLIADEPTTALDVTVQADVLELIRELSSKLDAGVLFITHDMGVVADIADRVAVLRYGKLVESASAERLFSKPRADYTKELLAAVPSLGSTDFGGDESATDNAKDEALLRFEAVDISYPGRLGQPDFKAVESVSLSVGRKEVVGLVGESGSGKSTLGRCAMGLVKASAGRVDVCGHDITHMSARRMRAFRGEFSMVFQDPASSLNPRESIGEVVGKPLRLHSDLGRREIITEVGTMLERVRLPASWAERYPHELSGGQRQRIGIARALILKPRLLVADEPTSALDVAVQATVLELFKELQAELEFACLFISHDLGVVEQLADQVAVLQSGKLVEFGPSARILRKPQTEYTQRLLLSAPVPNPQEQAQRRRAYLDLVSSS